MAETSADRVVRLLALVAYLDDHPGVPVARVAEHFGVSQAQVLRDVDTLWVSGTPGYQHSDLIDFSADDHEQNLLTLVDPQGMDTPLRLGPGEAVALLVALRSLAHTPGVGDREVVASALEKLTAAAGTAAEAAHAIDVHTDVSQVAGHLEAIGAAIDQQRQVHLRYVSAADEVSERTVDPIRLLTDSQRYFLHGWCHRAQDLRQFRVDRILDLEVLPSPAEEHPEANVADSPDPELTAARWRVRLELASRARWVAEHVPGADVTELGDGRFAVHLDVLDLAWLRNLVLGLGPDVHTVEPAHVATDLADYARRALAASGEEHRPAP